MTKANKTLGGIADQLYKLRAQRLELSRQVDSFKREEAYLTEVAMDKLRESRLDRASGKLGTISRQTKVVAKVTDWDAFYRDVAKRGVFDVLFRRVNNGVYAELLESEAPLAGSKAETVAQLSLTKASH